MSARIFAIWMICLFLPSSALAQEKSDDEQVAEAPAAAPSPAAKGLQAVEVVRDELFKRKAPKAAGSLAAAYALMNAGKFQQARAKSIPLHKDETYGDHALAISADSYRQEALKLLGDKKKAKPEQVRDLAAKSFSIALQIEEKFPYSPFIKKRDEIMGQSELLIAEAWAAKKSWKSAVSSYEKAFQRLANANLLSMLRPENIENYSQSCSKKKSDLCASWITRFVGMYAKGSEENKAIAKHFPAEAQKAKPSYPQGKASQAYRAPDLDHAAFDAAMNEYFEGNYKKAMLAFQKMLDEYPRSTHRYRARYWLGQAYTQEQEHEKAQAIYLDLAKDAPLTYYGLLASLAAGNPIDSSIEAVLPDAIATDPYLLPAEALKLKRGEGFALAGAKALASQEFRDIRSRGSVSGAFLMYLATLNSEVGNYNSAFSIIGELIQRNYERVFSTYVLRLIFPVVHYDLIQKQATNLKLDPLLVLSLVKQESAFDSGARSHAGAMGLMQLMPMTANDVEPTVLTSDLVVADVNVRIGTRYLKKLIDRFNGNLAYALAGYNAGPNAVARWVREGKPNRSMLEFIESIPYKETREYVSGIIRNYFWYAKRLDPENPKSLSYFWNIYGPPPTPVPVPATHESNGKAEMHDVPVANDVLFALKLK